MYTAGISIFAKGGLQNGGIRPSESLCNKIYGFDGSVCHTDSISRQVILVRKAGFKRIRFRFRIIPDSVNPCAQICFQCSKIYFAIDIGAEISSYRMLIFIGVVSVSFNQWWSVFYR